MFEHSPVYPEDFDPYQPDGHLEEPANEVPEALEDEPDCTVPTETTGLPSFVVRLEERLDMQNKPIGLDELEGLTDLIRTASPA